MIDFGMPALIELPNLTECAKLCRDLGLRFIELNMNLPQFQCDKFDCEVFERVARDYGIYYTIHLDENLNPCDFNPLVADAYLKTVLEIVAFAKQLNIPILNMHLSRGVYFTFPDRKVYLYQKYMQQYLEKILLFRNVCDKAVGEFPIRICVENCEGYTDFQINALDILLESPSFGLTFDIGHNLTAGGNDERVIKDREHKLEHFHFHDSKWQKNHLALGEGTMEISKYLLTAEKKHCRVVLETKTIESLKLSVNWLKRNYLYES